MTTYHINGVTKTLEELVDGGVVSLGSHYSVTILSLINGVSIDSTELQHVCR